VSEENALFVSNVNSRHIFLIFSTDFIVPHRHHAVTILLVSTVFDTVLPGWSGWCMLGTKHILLLLVALAYHLKSIVYLLLVWCLLYVDHLSCRDVSMSKGC